MEQQSIAPMQDAFARAYHRRNSVVRVFDDPLALPLIGEHAYDELCGLALGRCSALLGALTLGRCAWIENSLKTAVMAGAMQYLIFGSGFDTFAYRQPVWARRMRIFEIDNPAVIAEKRRRLRAAGLTVPPNLVFAQTGSGRLPNEDQIRRANFTSRLRSFCAMPGAALVSSPDAFASLIGSVASELARGSTIVFDYASEGAFAAYPYRKLEEMLSDRGLLIYEHLTPEQITSRFYGAHNAANPASPLISAEGVCFALAVKSR